MVHALPDLCKILHIAGANYNNFCTQNDSHYLCGCLEETVKTADDCRGEKKPIPFRKNTSTTVSQGAVSTEQREWARQMMIAHNKAKGV